MATATKESVADKLGVQLKKKNEKIKELESEVNKLNKELKSAQRGMSIYSTEDEVKKKVLELRSKNYSPNKILDRCDHVGIDIELNTIKDIVNNIEELSSDLRLHYRKCVEDYEKEIKINPQILKQASLDDVQFQIDQIKEIIAECDDTESKVKHMGQLNEYIKTRNAILKDVVLGEDDIKQEITVINTMSDDYEEQKSKVFKFRIDEDMKVIN
jgi:uncharacterized FAD-dependent dehydrogenase